MEIAIPGSNSLKDKRKILQRVKMGARKKFNISIAETANQDKWRSAQITSVMVSNDKVIIQKTFASIIKLIEEKGEAEVVDYQIVEIPMEDA